MYSTSQAARFTQITNPQPCEPPHIVTIPDWIARCEWQGPDNRTIKSTLVLEYKDRGLARVNKILEECTEEELSDDEEDKLQQGFLMRKAKPMKKSFTRIAKHYRHRRIPNTSRIESTLGKTYPCVFAVDVEKLLQQTTAYALAEGAPYVGLLDYESLVVFEFLDMKTSMKRTPVDRLRAGTGKRVRVVTIRDDPGESRIRRILIGAWLKAIRGE
ncbi:hypothetical protein CGRA01v4_13144 [Colletotrichum graminicola]|uniref:Uncharacterized protein n=1 Tax=Colletotrichum graminicola (strain M1.001 / M2 / FGSC 10212) TaxID=645133 RepID=E3QM77_COLGM|nr:uncharacterized protein GLRG_07109 [Colletotrichum graminicola M1.001]EFQ31965.1 hypothetical protein GLRG_07109 [Colletotrichum graminicola M1.001]WDK21854.1 hypothetical protein CGRA01v4_13144 [Colletotrichum graminicola]